MEETINEKLNQLYEELNVLEKPWQELINKYHGLQSNEQTMNSEESKKCHREIILIQDKMKAIRDRIHTLENLFSKEPLPLKTDYEKEDADLIRASFESTLYKNEDENNLTR